MKSTKQRRAARSRNLAAKVSRLAARMQQQGLGIDYEELELRVLAAMSEDEKRRIFAFKGDGPWSYAVGVPIDSPTGRLGVGKLTPARRR